MGYVRLFRRVHIAPGVTLNLQKGRPSLSLGVRGAHVTMGRYGVRRTIGLPGTGLFYTSSSGRHTGMHSAPHFGGTSEAEPAPATRRHGWTLLGVLVFLFLIGQYCAPK